MNLIDFAKFVIACISGHISLTSCGIYLLYLSHFVMFHLLKTSWVLSETCELVVVCNGLTRNHMIKLTAQFYADDLRFNQLITHSEIPLVEQFKTILSGPEMIDTLEYRFR